MKRTLNVLLTLAIITSVVSLAYYLSEWIINASGHQGMGSRWFAGEGDWMAGNYIKFFVYWVTGFAGFYIFSRVVSQDSFMKNALLIAFGYLLLIGANGGFDFSGLYHIKIILGLINLFVFCAAYRQFERKYYPAAA